MAARHSMMVEQEEAMLEGKTVVLGVSGSIAAYKAAYLASALVKQGADVTVILTENGAKFITPVTFDTLTGNRCLTDTFDRNHAFEVEHISISEKADLMVIAPATANVIAKLANGLADDMLTTTALACEAQILVAPAMNTRMWNKPVTQQNIQKIQELGMRVISPISGRLACGTVGTGKMAEPEQILEEIMLEIGRRDEAGRKLLEGKKVLVSAGPTREAVDPVRFLSNHSTGKMGFALAKQAALCGAEVTLVAGPSRETEFAGVQRVDVVSAEEMYQVMCAQFPQADITIMSAAVADYRPCVVYSEKVKKTQGALDSIPLEGTKDILAELGRQKRPGQFLCGFSMETEHLLENSRKKLEKKNLDMVVANSIRQDGAGFAGDTNICTLISEDREIQLPLLSKDETAFRILEAIAGRM